VLLQSSWGHADHLHNLPALLIGLVIEAVPPSEALQELLLLFLAQRHVSASGED
jgi:hypothetical protein